MDKIKSITRTEITEITVTPNKIIKKHILVYKMSFVNKPKNKNNKQLI